MTYEYACSACGHTWEAEQRISEPALDTCPACNQKSARRMVSGGAGFILKGGGWYSDGYSSTGSGKGSGGSQGSGGAKGEGKSAAKAEGGASGSNAGGSNAGGSNAGSSDSGKSSTSKASSAAA